MTTDARGTSDGRSSESDSVDEIDRKTTYSALDVLRQDLRDLLYDSISGADRPLPVTPLMDGFDSLRGAVNWYQAATVRTLGYIQAEFPPANLVRDSVLRRDLCGGPDRRPRREKLAEHIVIPAWHDAYEHLLENADERLDTDDRQETYTDIDPKAEKNIAMRPALTKLDDLQVAVLDDLWGGFDSRDEIHYWLLDLVPATHGSIDKEIAQKSLSERVSYEHLRDPSRDGIEYRIRLAAAYLLPAMANGAKRMRAGATSTQDSPASEVPQG